MTVVNLGMPVLWNSGARGELEHLRALSSPFEVWTSRAEARVGLSGIMKAIIPT